MPNDFDFKFLEERPLEKSEEFTHAKFGHEEISSALCKIISKCPTPFTLGLFGRWGAGKSTIANSIKEKLLPKNIAVVIFDVWKHEGDALRRTFLKEATQQLKTLGVTFFDPDFTLDERLEQSVSRSSESRFKFPSEKFKQLGPWIISGLFMLTVGAFLADKYGFFESFMYFISALFGSATAGGLLLWLIKQSLQLFSTETITYGVDKLQDPHQFETEFGRILGGLKNQRLLVVFDNLDRVTHDKALEVLSTVKTFLEPKDIENIKKEVVFLVPCDARAIKSHVANVYKSNGVDTPFNPDEFLRKFFNSIIWIPDFIPSELESFARTSLKNTRVSDLEDDRVAWIITKAFRENPRQIVQFTNILLANYILVREREEKKDLPDDFAKTNIAQLTKYLILSELFPEEMESLREMKVVDLEEVKETDLDTKNKKAFLQFLAETRSDIPINNLRIFFTLRRSEQEKELPGVETFISLLEDKKIDEARKYFEKLGDFSKPQTREDFSQVIKAELENKTNPVSIIGLVGSLLTLLNEKGIALSNTAYGEINNKLCGVCLNSLHNIDPAVLNQQLLAPFPAYRQAIVGQWVEVAENYLDGKGVYKISESFVSDVLQIFAENPSYLNTSLLGKIKKLLHEKLAADGSIAEIFIKDAKTQKNFITPDYVRTALNAVPVGGEPTDITNRFSILERIIADIIKSVGGDFIVKKLAELITAENQRKTPEKLAQSESVITAITGFIDKHKDTFAAANEQSGDLLGSNADAMSDAIPDVNNRKILIPLLIRIAPIVGAGKKSEIQTRLQNFYTQANTGSIDHSLERIEDPIELLEDTQYTTLQNRALGDQSFFDYFYKKLSKEKQGELLIKLFDSDYNRALQYADQLAYKLPNPKTFAEKALARFDGLPPAEKKRMLDVIITLKGANDAGVRDMFAEKIQALLTTTDVNLQNMGHSLLVTSEAFLSETRKRQIGKNVFDWLKKPEIPKNQSSSIRAVYALREQFNEEEEKELLQFIFEELIRKSHAVQEVDLGFSLLKDIAPKYDARKQNFDDIKTRTEAEPAGAVRQSMVKGIKSLRPDSVNQKNKAFWEWVDSLSI